ncbi:MAG: YciI family protein [Myxococcales bacterium]|nr:YciI family protein [Myxococcales bacterium]
MPAAAPGKALDPKAHKEYLLLIYEDEGMWAKLSEAESKAIFGKYYQFTQEIQASGHYLAGEPLDSVKKAKSVRLEGDRRVVRDGPFAETREQLGGYYRILAKDLDEAIAIAARVPAAETGTMEVRPVMDTSAYA